MFRKGSLYPNYHQRDTRGNTIFSNHFRSTYYCLPLGLSEFNLFYQNIVREQRSSSEDSITKLLQSAPLIQEEDADGGFAISKESYSKLSKMKAQMVFSETELGVS